MRLIPGRTSSSGFAFVIFTILLFLLTTPLASSGGELSLIGSALLTDVKDVDYHGSRVLGAFGGGAILLDFSDPGAPSHVGYLSTHEPCQDVILTDSIAFLSCGEQGVLLVAVGDSLADGPRSTIETAGTAGGIFLAWPLLYVATGGYGLEVFDISSPISPIPRGKLALDGAPGEVWVEGGEACVSGHDGWLWVIGLSDPDSLTLLRSTRTEGLQAWDVTRFDQTAYVADKDYLASYDVSDLGLRQLFDTPGRALDLYLDYPRLYLADDLAGTHLFSVTGLGNLSYVVTFPSLIPGEDSRGVAARHDTVIIGEDMTGVIMVDWADSLQPEIAGMYPVPGEIRGAQPIGNHLIAVAEWNKGLRIVRMKENGEAEHVSLTAVDSTLRDVEVQDTLVFLPAGSHGVQVVNISDPEAPLHLASVSTGRSVTEVRVSGKRLYAVDGDFKVIDIADPTDPVLTGSLITPTFSNDLSLESPEVICIAEAESGLIVISAPPGGQPQIIGRKATGGYVQGVFVQEAVVFLADKDAGLVVMDISDPSRIVTVGNVAVDGIPPEVVVAGERAVLGLQAGGLAETPVRPWSL